MCERQQQIKIKYKNMRFKNVIYACLSGIQLLCWGNTFYLPKLLSHTELKRFPNRVTDFKITKAPFNTRRREPEL